MTESGEPEASAEGGIFRWPTSYVGIVHPLADGRNGRERAEEFVRLAGAALGGASYKDAKKEFDVSHQQAETRKSMMEEMGLLYVPKNSNRVIVTPVGRQLFDLLTSGNAVDDPVGQKRINAVIAWALSNSQINRPQSSGSPSPTEEQSKTCDIRPYAAGWQAILDLDGWMRVDEFFGALWLVHRVDQFQTAIERIRQARLANAQLVDPVRFARGGDLYNPRLYWRPHLSSGGTILTVEDDDRFVISPSGRELAETVLRFAGGCVGGTNGISFQARPYRSVEEYFEEVAGRACPEFLFSGFVRVENVDKQPVAFLEGYQTEVRGDEIFVRGGPELCPIAINTPCYHKSVPDRLLRVAEKAESSDYKVVLTLRKGRPFTGTF